VKGRLLSVNLIDNNGPFNKARCSFMSQDTVKPETDTKDQVIPQKDVVTVTWIGPSYMLNIWRVSKESWAASAHCGKEASDSHESSSILSATIAALTELQERLGK
jgi:hypothetical protein